MEAFDWGRIAMNGNPPLFLLEVFVRSLTIFIVTFAFLRIIGRRGVKQMTPLEVVILLVLGSAASDVALQEDFPFLPVIVTFVVITFSYKLLTYSVRKSEAVQRVVEGEPVLVVREGQLLHEKLDQLGMTMNELLMELRQKSIEHLGQVRLALMELDGNVSVYFFPDDAVRPGLPILPKEALEDEEKCEENGEALYYSCCHCGHTVKQTFAQLSQCSSCDCEAWERSCQAKRVG